MTSLIATFSTAYLKKNNNLCIQIDSNIHPVFSYYIQTQLSTLFSEIMNINISLNIYRNEKDF